MARPLGAFRSLNHCAVSKRLGCRAEGSTLLSLFIYLLSGRNQAGIKYLVTHYDTSDVISMVIGLSLD
jgi:hypothetical protein